MASRGTASVSGESVIAAARSPDFKECDQAALPGRSPITARVS